MRGVKVLVIGTGGREHALARALSADPGVSAVHAAPGNPGMASIATLPIGYADGYNRKLSNTGYVLIHGRRASIVGLVCMDMTMIDVTDIPSVQVGDVVTLIGRDGEEAIGADDLAKWTSTIPYETLCAFGSRIPRVYSHSN